MRRNLLNKEWIYRFSVAISRILPLWLLRGISRFIAVLNYLFFVEARTNVEKNLSHVYNDRRKIKLATKEIFLNYGGYVADWAKLNHVDTAKIFEWFGSVKGRDIIEQALRRGKGVILVTAHLGNWELGGLFFSHADIPINVITAQDTMEGIANVRKKTRAFHNVKTITMDKNSLFFVDIINALQRNEIVAMLIDRYEGKNGASVDFFGKPALFPIGPILLARSTGATVVPAFTVLGPDGKYKAIIDSIVDMEFSDDKEKDIKLNLAKVVRIVEKYILEYTHQWYNFVYLWGDAKDS